MPALENAANKFQQSSGTLVRYVEVWTPSEDATRLCLRKTRVTGTGQDRRAKNQVTAVAKGEGLAGAAWESQTVAILHQTASGQLDRINSRCGEELQAVLAIPVFSQQEIRGVVIIGFGDGFGAAELWTRDDRDELTVSASHYSGLPSFEFISRYTRFPKGAGVPGRVWQTGQPYLLQNLGQSDAFIRSFGNDPAEIGAAIGVPIGYVRGFPASVLLLLSATNTPLSAITELWECESLETGEDEDSIVGLVSSTSIGRGRVEFDAQSPPESWQSAVLEKIDASGSPVLVDVEDVELPSGAKCHLAIPFFKHSRLRNVLNLMF